MHAGMLLQDTLNYNRIKANTQAVKMHSSYSPYVFVLSNSWSIEGIMDSVCKLQNLYEKTNLKISKILALCSSIVTCDWDVPAEILMTPLLRFAKLSPNF